jgi:hypothetical protein
MRWPEETVPKRGHLAWALIDEFSTVDLLLASHAETRGVDAFALSLIKAEKQARRLMTYLVYQHPWCSQATVPQLKAALETSTKVYFNGLLAGWNALYPRSVEQLVGSAYKRLRPRLGEASKHRNKIFHGQLTAQGLTRAELLSFVKDIRAWCEAFGSGAQAEVGYDGCGRNSLRKSGNAAVLCAKYKTPLPDIAAYRQFIKAHMER